MLAMQLQGAASTLFRDIPFSAMFFCSYGVLKDEWATDANGKVEFSKVLIAGMASGMGAGWLSTPMECVDHSPAHCRTTAAAFSFMPGLRQQKMPHHL
jgi:hypothetical protein